jgi:hypothetical protein
VIAKPREVGLKGGTNPSQGGCESPCQSGIFGTPMRIMGCL